jgi:hypothetical protein
MTTDTATTTDTLTILVPVNEVEPRRAQLARRPASLRGLRLAVLENGKPNSDRLLQALIADLETADGVKVTAFERKPAIGKLAPAPMIDHLVSAADVIITGVGDCAGCCSCSVADAIMLEQRGIPVAAVCTTEFVTAAAVASAAAGAPGYEVAVIPHPLGSCTDAELAARAAAIADRVRDLLTE